MFSGELTGRRTCQQLIELAATAGTPTSRRLITDWVRLGLLDRPSRRSLGYRGSLPAEWPAVQGDVLTLLLRLRCEGNPVEVLCNVPVRIWLTSTDGGVPLRQVRRAMTTWATSGTAGGKRVFRRLVAEFLQLVADPGRRPDSRARVVRQVQVAFQRVPALDPQGLQEIMAQLMSRETPLADSSITQPNIETVVALLESVRQAVSSLGEVPNEAFLVARLLLRMGLFSPTGSKSAHRMTCTEVLATLQGQTIGTVLNRTCQDMAIALGLLLRSDSQVKRKLNPQTASSQ